MGIARFAPRWWNEKRAQKKVRGKEKKPEKQIASLKRTIARKFNLRGTRGRLSTKTLRVKGGRTITSKK